MEYLPPPTKIHDCIGGGTSFNVTFLPPDRVLKWTHKDVPHDAEQERKILELLGPHPRIVRYFGMWKEENTSIVLEYHPGFEPNRNDADTDIPRRRWAVQIAEGLAYIHSKGIVHGDVNASNVLVTSDDDIVMCDFVGSSLDGEKAFAPCHEARHFRPRERHEDDIRFVQDDLFALGSLLYELYTHQKPYARQRDHEVEKLYREGIFPDVSRIPVGSMITKCWTGG
ncbi:tkl protein kinase [Diplogelasinospora grovesii]|uniref:Tkl protein kinase n=1 Tax=Diplogelasinospora grovesii TaxID=303347 RepID=A0AAN6N3D6_9PEZI|nr:tkl protein kinase [Diplogelasinospora grovesii]